MISLDDLFECSLGSAAGSGGGCPGEEIARRKSVTSMKGCAEIANGGGVDDGFDRDPSTELRR
jgi:hypothetical protein